MSTFKVKEGSTLLRTIFARIKAVEGLRYDKELAVPLHTTAYNITNMKTRDSIPWTQLVQYCRERQISLEWLVNGQGPAFRHDLPRCEDGALLDAADAADCSAAYRLAGMITEAADAAGARLTGAQVERLVGLLHADEQRGIEVDEVRVREMVGLLA